MRYLTHLLGLTMLSTAAFTHGADEAITLVTEKSPFTQVSNDESSLGEATQFIQRVLDEAQLSYELQYLPWRRAYEFVSSRPRVLIYPLAKSKQREARFQWVGELIPVNYYLFKLRSRNDITIKSLDDARQYRIGVVNYHVHHEYLLSENFTGLQPVNNNIQNIKKTLLGRIDLFPISDGGLTPVCEQENIDCSQFEPVFKLEDISGGLYMAYSLETPNEIVQATRAAYQKLHDNGVQLDIFASRLRHVDHFNELWSQAKKTGR